ncbi:MAG: Rpn family recombination-promoting nuclease/putative transposase [Candidatus Delongbacteria bacterium]|nr:Rpn family recombination-promoting nuclease/putative transposase [Candidatus Delongbacteria bacterium]MBN2835780.1 Rpn family recombination-promoting nuclease/putative transposase [Candidatus Delongbacteria bacterium]
MRFNIHQFYDKTYTKLFSHKRMAEDFIKGFLKEDFAKDIVLIEKLETKFITKKFNKYESDLIYKAKFKDKDAFVFILMEFQTRNDNLISLRLLNYISLFYINYIKQTKTKPPLPPVIPIVIHIGQDKFTEYTAFSQLVNIPYNSLKKYVPDFTYFLVDLQKIPKTVLNRLTIHSKNIASLLFSIDQYDENQLLQNLHKVIILLKENLPPELLNDFGDYISSILSQNDNEYTTIYNTIAKEPSMLYYTIQKMRKNDVLQAKLEGKLEGKREGKMEGKIEGRLEGKLEIVKNAIKKGLSLELISELTGLSISKIKELSTK